jgi:hypothetical protein
VIPAREDDRAREKGSQKDWGLAEDITDFIFSIFLVRRGEDRRGWAPLVLVDRISNLFLEGKNHEGRSAQTVRWRINEGPHGWSYELGTGKPRPLITATQIVSQHTFQTRTQEAIFSLFSSSLP